MYRIGSNGFTGTMLMEKGRTRGEEVDGKTRKEWRTRKQEDVKKIR